MAGSGCCATTTPRPSASPASSAGCTSAACTARTAWALRRFQSERRIEDRGYLGYGTLSALEGPPPPPPYYRGYWGRPTTFDTGVITWPGKVIF